ncbi:MAG: 4-hydroxy-2-oxoheptanedioate aldolase [Candidatus Promineifilaceae bacterium]|jgi:4-hydroxy-2-oxoheptanedioate aldolase
MRKSKVLAKWRHDKFARFAAMGHVLPFFINYAAHHKFDGIWLDLEHRNMENHEVQHLLTLSHLFDIDMMIRPPTTMRGQLYRYLEDGATGLMMPFVSTPEIAREIVQSTKFPPMGNRGLDGAGLDCRYGLDTWVPGSTYIKDAIEQTFIVAQIETPEAVHNADAIAAVEGIDCLFIGPGDLGLRFEAEPDNTMTMEFAMETVAAAAKKHGKVWARTAGSVEEIAKYREMGAQMVPWGGDFSLMNVLKEASEGLDSIGV